MFGIRKLVLTVAITSALALGITGTASAAPSPGSAYVSGGQAHGAGYYRYGAHDWGTVYDTAADGACVHADVKLALNNYGDYTWTEARACGFDARRDWNKDHYGPILSSFYMSAVQGVYLRVCRERNNLPDSCGGWSFVGR